MPYTKLWKDPPRFAPRTTAKDPVHFINKIYSSALETLKRMTQQAPSVMRLHNLPLIACPGHESLYYWAYRPEHKAIDGTAWRRYCAAALKMEVIRLGRRLRLADDETARRDIRAAWREEAKKVMTWGVITTLGQDVLCLTRRHLDSMSIEEVLHRLEEYAANRFNVIGAEGEIERRSTEEYARQRPQDALHPSFGQALEDMSFDLIREPLPTLKLPRTGKAYGKTWRAGETTRGEFQLDCLRHEGQMRRSLEGFNNVRAAETLRMSYTSWQLWYIVAALWPGRKMPFLWLRYLKADQYATALVLLFRRPEENRAFVEDLLPQEMVDLIDKARAEQGERIADIRAAGYPSGRRWDQTRVMNFVRCQARAALIRQGESPSSGEFKGLWETMVGYYRAELAISDDCRLCGVQMLTVFPPAYKESTERNIRPNVATLDCIVPRRRGGQYTPQNVQLLCWGCNCIKGGYTQRQAEKIVEALYYAEEHCVMEDGLLVDSAPQPETVHPSRRTKDAISAWATRTLEEIRARCDRSEEANGRKIKRCSLRRRDLRTMVEEELTSQDLVHCHLGISVPLPMLSVDRLDPDGHYTKRNVRLTLVGANNLRSDSFDDRPLAKYIRGIREVDAAGDVEWPHANWRRAYD